jgi:hypothetical protein
MSAIVVYESIYGNTREVAEAIASGIGDARVVSVHEAPSQVTKPDLLVVGGPTHVHGLTSQRSRTAAAQNAHCNVELGAADRPGLRPVLGRGARQEAAHGIVRRHGVTPDQTVIPGQTASGTISIAPHGHSWAHRPQPLQKS